MIKKRKHKTKPLFLDLSFLGAKWLPVQGVNLPVPLGFEDGTLTGRCFGLLLLQGFLNGSLSQ